MIKKNQTVEQNKKSIIQPPNNQQPLVQSQKSNKSFTESNKSFQSNSPNQQNIAPQTQQSQNNEYKQNDSHQKQQNSYNQQIEQNDQTIHSTFNQNEPSKSQEYHENAADHLNKQSTQQSHDDLPKKQMQNQKANVAEKETQNIFKTTTKEIQTDEEVEHFYEDNEQKDVLHTTPSSSSLSSYIKNAQNTQNFTGKANEKENPENSVRRQYFESTNEKEEEQQQQQESITSQHSLRRQNKEEDKYNVPGFHLNAKVTSNKNSNEQDEENETIYYELRKNPSKDQNIIIKEPNEGQNQRRKPRINPIRLQKEKEPEEKQIIAFAEGENCSSGENTQRFYGRRLLITPEDCRRILKDVRLFQVNCSSPRKFRIPELTQHQTTTAPTIRRSTPGMSKTLGLPQLKTGEEVIRFESSDDSCESEGSICQELDDFIFEPRCLIPDKSVDSLSFQQEEETHKSINELLDTESSIPYYEETRFNINGTVGTQKSDISTVRFPTRARKRRSLSIKKQHQITPLTLPRPNTTKTCSSARGVDPKLLILSYRETARKSTREYRTGAEFDNEAPFFTTLPCKC